MTALTILLIVQILLMAVIICLLLRYDDGCKNCNRHDRLPTYYHEKKPNNTKDEL